MEPATPALERLQNNVKLFAALVEGLEAVVRACANIESEPVRIATPFLQNMWALAAGMRDILRARRQDGRTVWNAPALSVLARALQETYINFYYFAVERPDEEEVQLRRRLWGRHQVYKRLDLLQRADQSVPEVLNAKEDARRAFLVAQDALLEDPKFRGLPKSKADSLATQKDRYIAEPLEDIWGRAGMFRDHYGTTFRYFSQSTHATPYALVQLAYHAAGTEDGAVNMNVPVGLALMCCASALDHVGNLHKEIDALIPGALRAFLKS